MLIIYWRCKFKERVLYEKITTNLSYKYVGRMPINRLFECIVAVVRGATLVVRLQVTENVQV
mgnify:CR=1 FL=1|jgi:hypothetical protein